MSLFTIINVIIIISVIKNVKSFPQCLNRPKRLGTSSNIIRRTTQLQVFASNGTDSSSNNNNDQYLQQQLQLQQHLQQQQQQQYSENRLRSELMSAIDGLKELFKVIDSNNKESLKRIENSMEKMETDNKESFKKMDTDNKESFKAIDTKFSHLDKKVTILQILVVSLCGFFSLTNSDIKSLLSVLFQYIKLPSL